LSKRKDIVPNKLFIHGIDLLINLFGIDITASSKGFSRSDTHFNKIRDNRNFLWLEAKLNITENRSFL
jgi:hypothetical protein